MITKTITTFTGSDIDYIEPYSINPMIDIVIGDIYAITYTHNEETNEVTGILLFSILNRWPDQGLIEIRLHTDPDNIETIIIENVCILDKPEINYELYRTMIRFTGNIKENKK